MGCIREIKYNWIVNEFYSFICEIFRNCKFMVGKEERIFVFRFEVQFIVILRLFEICLYKGNIVFFQVNSRVDDNCVDVLVIFVNYLRYIWEEGIFIEELFIFDWFVGKFVGCF